METVKNFKSELASFDIIYRKNYTKILNYILQKVHILQDAEELTNDVFIKAHKALSSFDSSKSQLTTWLCTIANNCVIDFYRTNKVKQNLFVSVDVVLSENEEKMFNSVEPVADILESSRMVDIEQMKGKISKVFEGLKDSYKLVSELFFIQGLKYHEIVEKTGYSMENVKVSIFRSRKLLQSNLSNEYSILFA